MTKFAARCAARPISMRVTSIINYSLVKNYKCNKRTNGIFWYTWLCCKFCDLLKRQGRRVYSEGSHGRCKS